MSVPTAESSDSAPNIWTLIQYLAEYPWCISRHERVPTIRVRYRSFILTLLTNKPAFSWASLSARIRVYRHPGDMIFFLKFSKQCQNLRESENKYLDMYLYIYVKPRILKKNLIAMI